MTVHFPEAEKAQGRINVAVIPAAALTSTSSPSAAEILAEGLHASMYLYGSPIPSSTTTTGEAPARFGSTDQLPQFGRTTHNIPELQYVYKPQAAADDPANDLYDMLTPGEEFYLIYGHGVDADTVLASGDKVNLWLVEAAAQNEGATGDGEFDELSVTQVMNPKAPPIKGVTLAA